MRKPPAFLLPALLAVLFTADAAPAADAKPRPKVILVSCDGTRPDAIATLGEELAPNFHRLGREGASTHHARTDHHYTITLPNHTCMITGRGVVGDEGHSWIKNSDPQLGENLHRNRNGYVSSVFAVAHDHGLRTALFASKSKFSLYDLSYDGKNGEPDTVEEDNGRDKIDVAVIESDTAALVESLANRMQSEQMDFIMLHLRNPDSAGHAFGWKLEPGSDYLNAVQATDGLLGKVLDAIESTEGYRGNTYLIVTADHGGWIDTKGHGESEQPDNFTIPFYAWGPQVPAGADLYGLNPEARKEPGEVNPEYDAEDQPIRNGDAGNLALSLLGLPAIPGSTINRDQDLEVRTKRAIAENRR